MIGLAQVLVTAVIVTVVVCDVFSDFRNDLNRENGPDLGLWVILSAGPNVVFVCVSVGLCVCPGRNSAVDLALPSSVLGELMDAAVNESLNELEVFDIANSKLRIKANIKRVACMV